MNICSKLIIILTLLIAIVSCTDINSWGDSSRTPSLKASFIYFPKSQIELGGTDNLSTTVQLQAVSTPWRILNPASEWLTVSPTEGAGDETITFAAKENPTSDNIRTAVLSLESADVDYAFSRPLTVNQSKANSVLAPDAHSIEFTRESQKRTIDVIANTDWKADCSATWIHLIKSSDTSLIITIDENNEEATREATVTLSGSKTTEIKVVQTGISITPSQTRIELSREAQTKTIDVAANYNWVASCSANWVHLTSSAASGKLSISVDENNGTSNRTATISLSGCASYVIEIIQTGISVIPDQTSLRFSREAQTKTIDVAANYNWAASCPANWVHLKSSPESGKLAVTVDENNEVVSRAATINLSGCASSGILVTQEGIYVTPAQANLELSHDAQVKVVDVSSNYDWIASSSANWLHLTPSLETGKLYISVDENKGTTDRTCDISFSKSSSQIKVLQHGLSFDELVSQLDFDTESSTQTLNIRTNGTWKATPNESWIHVSPASGTGNAVLSVSVDKNKETEKRNGTISVTVGNVIKYVSIQQKGAYLEVSTSLISTIPASGGTRSITFSTSENWSIERTNPSWVSADMTNGTAGNKTITLSFLMNTQKETRKDTTYIRTSNPYLQDLRIITIQEGMYLYITSSTSSEIPASGGTRKVSFMSSDAWMVDYGSDSWVSVDRTSGMTGSNTITMHFSGNIKYTNRTNTIYIRTNNAYVKDLPITTVQRGLEINNNGHEYVDLGLPSGTLWATCNVGASTPDGYGGYYAWGEVEPSNGRSWDNYKWSTSLYNMTKYCTSSSEGRVDNKTELEIVDDVARQNWGGDWRIPSIDQINELITECVSLWTVVNGTYGWRLTSKTNGNSIFLPLAGYNGSDAESCGDYWSRSLVLSSNAFAYSLWFHPDLIKTNKGFRRMGYSVRPVIDK